MRLHRFLALLLLPLALSAADRPKILGIAHVALYVHDVDQARAFYKGFLGFEEPFSLKNRDGSLHMAWIKVNDRQYIELFPEKSAGSDRLYQLSFQVSDAEAMRQYLASKGIAVPDHVPSGKSGTLNFMVKDPDGHNIEFVQYPPNSWMAKDVGQHLPDTRVSTRIPHAGIMVRHLDRSLAFYRDILGCEETWRGSKNKKTLSWVNLKLPDSADYIEFMLYGDDSAFDRILTMHHICLEVADVHATAKLLAGRPLPAACKRGTPPALGVNHKWQVNYYDADGTRVEVMEPHTYDNQPVPPSTAPPPA